MHTQSSWPQGLPGCPYSIQPNRNHPDLPVPLLSVTPQSTSRGSKEQVSSSVQCSRARPRHHKEGGGWRGPRPQALPCFGACASAPRPDVMLSGSGMTGSISQGPTLQTCHRATVVWVRSRLTVPNSNLVSGFVGEICWHPWKTGLGAEERRSAWKEMGVISKSFNRPLPSKGSQGSMLCSSYLLRAGIF